MKEECLSKLILVGENSLRRALNEYVAHFHSERNHQGKGKSCSSRTRSVQLAQVAVVLNAKSGWAACSGSTGALHEQFGRSGSRFDAAYHRIDLPTRAALAFYELTGKRCSLRELEAHASYYSRQSERALRQLLHLLDVAPAIATEPGVPLQNFGKSPKNSPSEPLSDATAKIGKGPETPTDSLPEAL